MSIAAPPSAIEAFVAALGEDKVLTSEDELREFRDPFQFETWDDYSASAVVMPTTVEEVQAVVRVANERRVPLWTHGRDEQRLRRAGAARRRLGRSSRCGT